MDASEWIGLAGVVVAGLGVLAAYSQLNRGAKALEASARANHLSALTAMLQIESSINGARSRLIDSARTLRSKKSESIAAAREAEEYMELCIEGYLDALDRLCSAIRYGLVAEKIYRKDYREVLQQAVRKHPNRFAAGTHFRHIRFVEGRWSDDKSAKDEAIPELSF